MSVPVSAANRPVKSGFLLGFLAWGAVGLVLLPMVGMALAYVNPPGLLAPPPMPLGRVLPLLGRTLSLAFVVSFLAWALGSWLAWVETRSDFRGRRILSIMAILPLAVPSYLVAAMVREEMAPMRPLGQLFGIDGQFTGFWPAVLVLTVTCTPYVHLLTAAALRRCPVAEEEAARALGAPMSRVFRWVLFPRLRSTWAFSTLLVGLYVVSDFGAVAVLDCEVLTWELYKARGGPDAVLLGGVLILAVVPLLVGVRLLQGQGTSERGISTRPGERRNLGWLASGATWVGATFLVGIGVLLPVLSLIQWGYSGWVNELDFAPVLGPAGYTLLYAGLGALLVLSAAWSPARIGVDARRSGSLENGVYLTGSIPGVLIAVGLLHLILALKRSGGDGLVDALRSLEGVGLILLLAYVTRFLAQGYAALKPAVMRLDQSLDESAKSLGASPWRRFCRVTLPGIGPDAVAAYIIIFMSIAKELPITLLLLPLGETTLAYRIFDGQQEGSLPDVGLAGLVLMAMALIIHTVLQRGKRDD